MQDDGTACLTARRVRTAHRKRTPAPPNSWVPRSKELVELLVASPHELRALRTIEIRCACGASRCVRALARRRIARKDELFAKPADYARLIRTTIAPALHARVTA